MLCEHRDVEAVRSPCPSSHESERSHSGRERGQDHVGGPAEGGCSVMRMHMVWELDIMNMQWKEVDRMPNGCCLNFHGKKNVNKALLMLSLQKYSYTNQFFTYHLSTREWLKLPGSVLPTTHTRRRNTIWLSYGIAFHPCLTAIP
ncbi:hypothetical protein SASPL_130808 [Salvia splendens]|uniref:Uncharacterized protein n=1 Tax=Salvia splendens TaxID=180675 RepID=A0A8X8X7Y7_SALSN|nr:hypothetical protein SASPL_130808 [Salvia splendens]